MLVFLTNLVANLTLSPDKSWTAYPDFRLASKRKLGYTPARLEGSHSGLVHTLGKRATRKGSGVRISPPPPEGIVACRRFFLFYLNQKHLLVRRRRFCYVHVERDLV